MDEVEKLPVKPALGQILSSPSIACNTPGATFE